MEAAVAEKEFSRLAKTALRAPSRRVELRVNVFWLLAGIGVGQSGEVISRAAKREGELGLAASGFVFNHTSGVQPALVKRLLRRVSASKQALLCESNDALELTRQPFSTP